MNQEQKNRRSVLSSEIKEMAAQNPVVAGKIRDWAQLQLADYAEQYDNALDFPSVRFIQGGRAILMDVLKMVMRKA